MYAESQLLAGPRALCLSDSELLARSRACDEQAFGALIHRHQDLVVNYLTRMLGCRQEAEDMAQETFVRFFRHLDRYTDQGTLRAYLLRIATNLVRSRARRRARWHALEPLVRASERHRQTACPQAEALAGEAQRQLLDAIARLELRFRAPLILREIEGLPYRQIARALDTNEGTIKSRLHRARALLKDMLEPYWKGRQSS